MSKKIRVLHVAEAAGGVERYLETLFKYSDKQTVENILVCSQNYDINKFNNIASKVIVVNMVHKIDPKQDLFSINRVRSLIKKYKPDIVYGHSSKAGAISRIANMGLHSKCIYNPHGWAFNMRQSKKKKQMYIMIEKMLAPLCQKIVCISDAEKESALRYKICSAKKLQVIYNGIDFEEFDKEVSQKVNVSVPKNSFVIGMVGRLSEQKAPDVFVNAAKLIKEKIPNAYFLMVGDGDLRSDIELQIETLGLKDSFYITGWVDNPAAYMKLMDVGMLLSRWEGFGLVLPEYMLAGVPILATDVDAIPNIIQDGENGLLVEKDNYREASKQVIVLHDNSKIRNRIVKNAKQCVNDNFNGKRVAQESLNLFTSCKESR